MMKRLGAAAVVAALACPAFAANGGVVFESPEAAVAKSAATGKPICWYFTNDAPGASAAT